MSFPFTHIPANLTQVVFTGPFNYVPVNLGVDADTPEPEICWDLKQPDGPWTRIEFVDERVDYAPSDQIVITWSCSETECIGLWEWRRGSQVDFDFRTGAEWVSVPGTDVDFDFKCEVTPDECTTLWKDYQGNVVPIAFNKPWTTYQGNQVPITFACEGGGETPDYTYFTGYIDLHDGSEFDLTFEITSIVNMYVGETLGFKLNDFSAESFGFIDHYDGSHVGGAGCDPEAASDLQYILSAGNTGTLSNANPKSITFKTNGGTSSGVNVATVEAIRLDYRDNIRLSWKQLINGGWYDDDYTDAIYEVGFVFTDDPANITASGSSWRGRNPFHYDTTNVNPNFITAWLPYAAGTTSGNFRKPSNPGVSNGVIERPYTKGNRNLFNGASLLSLELSRSESNTAVISLYIDDVLIGSEDFGDTFPEYVVPVWHYNNYGNANTTISVTEINFNDCQDFLTTYPMQGLGLIAFPDGQTLNTELATDMVFAFNQYTGESVDPIYLGSDVQFDNVEFRDGQFSSVVLTDNPPWQIVTNAYDGSNVTAALSTSYVFDFNSYDGSVLSLTLSDTPFWYFYSGESAQLSLETYPSQNFGLIPNFTGETFSASLATTHSFAFNFSTGESATGYLSTDTNLELVEFRGGEYTSFALTENLPWQIVSNAYDGANVTFELSTIDTMRVFAYEGQVATLELDSRPAPEILITAFDGQTAQLNLSIAQSFGVTRSYAGESMSIGSMDNEQFWRMYAGESASVTLATETTLPIAGFTGETFALTLDVRKSEGLGTFRAYEGQRTDFTLNVLTAVLLYPNEISARQEFVCEFDITTSFDLLDTSCCPIKDTHERIELNDQPPPDEHYEGEKTVVQVDLSTLPRFTVDMVEGSEFKTVDPNFLGEFNFYDGHVPTINHLDFEFVDFKLCYGNFIPDGDATFIELISTYDDQCEADYIYTGESARLEVENNVQFQLNMYESEHMYFDLFVEPIIRINMYHGEYMRISNPEFSFHAHDGPGMSLVFDEPQWSFYTGEAMQIGNLTTEYDVEFLERGCLDNEFVPTNENGDPDWDNFNRVPVELEQYRHSILARCF